MSGKMKWFWGLYGIVLIALFLLSSTNLIIKEEKAEVYPISVIIADASDDNYVNYKKGMERAALEMNADVSFITLYERGNREQQEELMLREQTDGSRALIVAPVDLETIARMRDEKRITVPLVMVNSKIADIEDAEWITFDYYGMGEKMGEVLLGELPPGQTVCLLGRRGNDRISQWFAEGISAGLAPGNHEVLSFAWDSEEDVGQIYEEMTQNRTRRVVVAATDPESLSHSAQLLAEAEEMSGWIGGLYGRGNTVAILNYLDKGLIQGLCVTDDFSAGYLSVKTAVELAENRYAPGDGYLESYYIRREDLRDEKYQKLLYPIE